jgi:hypothetical protein
MRYLQLCLLFACFTLAVTSNYAQSEGRVIDYCFHNQDYHLNLVHNGVTLKYDTVYSHCHNYPANFFIKNNTEKTITIKYARVSDGSVYLQSYPQNLEVKPNETFELNLVVTRRIGMINRVITTYYYVDGEEMTSNIRIKGQQIDVHYLRKHQLEKSGQTARIDPAGYVVHQAPVGSDTIYYKSFKDTLKRSLNEAPAFVYFDAQKYPPYFKFQFTNDSRDAIVIDSVVSSNKQMVFYVLNGCNWRHRIPMTKEVASDANFFVNGTVLYYKEPNSIQSDLLIYYRDKGEDYYSSPKTFKLPIRGIIAQSYNSPIGKTTATKTTPPKTTTASKPVTTTTKSSYKAPKLPTDYTRFKEGTLLEIEKNVTNVIDLILDENKYYPSYPYKAPKRIPYILKWDSLTKEEMQQTHVKLKLTNKTDTEVYLVNLNGNRSFLPNASGSPIIPADSSLIIDVDAWGWYKGDFLGTFTVECKSNTWKDVNWTFHNWVYAKLDNEEKLTVKKTSELEDSVLVYIMDSTLSVTGNYHVSLKHKGVEKSDIRLDVNGYPCLQLPKSKDTLHLVISTPDLGVVLKRMLVTTDFEQRSYIYVSPNKGYLHTYRYNTPTLYETMTDRYFVKWDYEQGTYEEVFDYLSQQGLSPSGTCSSRKIFLKIASEKDASTFQNAHANNKYKIILLPAIKQSSINQHGWGGACKWHDNVFRIGFIPGTSKARITEIFEEIGASSYKQLPSNGSYVREREKNLIRYQFTLNNLIGSAYLDKLNLLWELSEVMFLTQNQGGTDALD